MASSALQPARPSAGTPAATEPAPTQQPTPVPRPIQRALKRPKICLKPRAPAPAQQADPEAAAP
eukprot:8080646-Alexandrium_andersonii.AAC.1